MLRIACLLVVLACTPPFAAGAKAGQDYRRVESVYDGDTTAVGERVVYPKGAAEVRAVVVTLMPGEETGWHVHGVPLFGYVLEGEVTVDYGAYGKRRYRRGAGFMEAMATAHDGRNTGTVPCRILAVFMGAKGLAPTRRVAGPGR